MGPVGTTNKKKTNMLTLYRRHTAGCDKAYSERNGGAKQKPTLYPVTKQARNADTCRCPINVHGYLEHHVGRIRHYSLDTPDWIEANTKADVIRKTGKLPGSDSVTVAPKDAPTVKFAVDAFLKSKEEGSGKVAPATFDIYKTFCNKRFLPWCEKNGVTLIGAFDDPHTTERFDQSWKNLKDGNDLADGARKTTKTVFTMVLGYCVDHDWLKKNTAKKIKMTRAKARHSAKEKKHGLELHEYANILRYMDDAFTEQRMKVMIELMRYVGMRVSDAAKFCEAELVRTNGGWNADFVAKKNGRECSVPVPVHVVEMLKALPYLHEKFWFRTGNAGWRAEAQAPGAEIAKIMKATQEKFGAFNHPASAHTLRHTFAIQRLNRGDDPRMVADWMGDDLTTVLKHYSHAIKSTKELRDEAGRKSNEAMVAATLSSKAMVTPIRKRA
jgi:site-specific recombinase XerD